MTSICTRRGSRFLIPLGVLMVVLVAGGVFLQQRQSLFAGASDYSSFYAASRIVWSGDGHNVYQYKKQKEAQAPFINNVTFRKGPLLYNHAPFELLIFMPFALLSYPHATSVWFCLNVIALLAVPVLLRERLAFLRREFFYSLLALAFFVPASVALVQGQDSILLLLLFSLGFLQFEAGNDIAAGCIFALAAFKPHLVLPLIVIMLATRRWKFLGSFAAACIALLGVSAMLVGGRTVVEYPRFLLEFSRLPRSMAGAYPENMPNLRGLLYAGFTSGISHAVLQALIVTVSAIVLLLVGIVCVRNTARISETNFALVMVASLLIGYHVNVHDLTLLLLPLFIVANRIAGQELTPSRTMLGMAAGLAYIVPSLSLPASVTALGLLLLFAALLNESLATPAGQQLPSLQSLTVAGP